MPAVGVPGAGAPAPADAAFAIWHGLYWLVANITQHRPLALIVDDLQWADPPSLRALAYVAGRLDGLPVLIAAAHRPGDPDGDPALLAELAAGAQTTLHPQALSPAGVRGLL
jgi:hypothetical protein